MTQTLATLFFAAVLIASLASIIEDIERKPL